jgi:hypothetical protein
MAASPDGKSLIAGYDSPFPSVDSFSVASDGTLTEHGANGGPFDFPDGVDITADSKYALFGETNSNGFTHPQVQIGIYAINPDGSLGRYNTFENLGPNINAYHVWLSPDEKFLYVSGDGKRGGVTTLNFDKSVPQVTPTGCSLRVGRSAGGMATAMPTSSGVLLYLGDFDGLASVALNEINATTGCLTEVPGSPFSSGYEGAARSVAAWPPRPF